MPDTNDPLDDLIGVAAAVGGADVMGVRSLAELLLAATDEPLPPRRGRSGLNSNGAPLELCLSAFADACRLRFIADPASADPDPLARRARSIDALAATLDRCGARALEALCAETIRAVIPGDEEVRTRYLEGVLWLGAGVGMPGAALYVDATKHAHDEAWTRAEEWLGRILPQPAAALARIEALAGAGDLMAVGIEGTSPANARAKLFWRMSRPAALADFGVPALLEPSFTRFLDASAADRDFPLTGIVFSISFLAATGQELDAKIDLCAHCLGHDDETLARLVDDLAAGFTLAPIATRTALANGGVAPAFLGLNRNALGQHRLDLFLKPARWYTEAA